jgi:CHAD domain-containing protein
MSFRLEPREPLPEGVRRIALEQIDKAVAQLRDQPDGCDEAVHDARKRFKKVRAVLRLVRDELGEEAYHRENICFRDAGRRLAAVRDSAVLLETLDYVAGHSGDERLTPALIAAIQHRLSYAHEYLSEHVLEREHALVIVIDTLAQARTRVHTWPIEHGGFSALAGGLQRVYKRGRNRLSDAYAAPSPENFHEWRKRTKYLWYHMRILNLLWPAVLKELADEVHELSNVLGLDHDLTVFHEKIVDLPEMSEDGRSDAFAELIDQQRAALLAAARPLGERIYAEKTTAFVNGSRATGPHGRGK